MFFQIWWVLLKTWGPYGYRGVSICQKHIFLKWILQNEFFKSISLQFQSFQTEINGKCWTVEIDLGSWRSWTFFFFKGIFFTFVLFSIVGVWREDLGPEKWNCSKVYFSQMNHQKSIPKKSFSKNVWMNGWWLMLRLGVPMETREEHWSCSSQSRNSPRPAGSYSGTKFSQRDPSLKARQKKKEEAA